MPESDRTFTQHILSLSTNASHENEVVFFPPQGITSSSSRPEIPQKNLLLPFNRKRGLILAFAGSCF